MNGTKLVGSLACVLVAIDCAERAMGLQGQVLFSPDALWIWWIVAACWVVNAIGVAVIKESI